MDKATWRRVQALLGSKTYRSHQMTYAGQLVTCGHCGRPITGEAKTKRTRKGEQEYVYYRCVRYNAEGHPRVRVREEDLDAQVLALFDRIRIEDEKVREWFLLVLRERAKDTQRVDRESRRQLEQEMAKVRVVLDRLVNLRLLEEIGAETFAAKKAELEERLDDLKLQAEVADRGHAENAETAVKAFELSQSLREKWVTADWTAKRHILEIICLNFRLDGVTLVPTIRKPFDVLTEGLVTSYGRGDWI